MNQSPIRRSFHFFLNKSLFPADQEKSYGTTVKEDKGGKSPLAETSVRIGRLPI